MGIESPWEPEATRRNRPGIPQELMATPGNGMKTLIITVGFIGSCLSIPMGFPGNSNSLPLIPMGTTAMKTHRNP